MPILALTANSSDELRERCRQQGMQAFLSKPLEAGELWTIVSRQLSTNPRTTERCGGVSDLREGAAAPCALKRDSAL